MFDSMTPQVPQTPEVRPQTADSGMAPTPTVVMPPMPAVAILPPASRSHKKIWIALFLVVLVAAAGVGAAYYFFVFAA